MREIKLGSASVVLRVCAEGDVISVSLSPEAGTVFGATPSVSATIVYGGEERVFAEEELDAVAEFVRGEERDVTLTADGLSVGGEKCESFTFTWDESAGTESADIVYSLDRVKELYSSTLIVKAEAREGVYVRPIALSCTYTNRSGSRAVRKYSLTQSEDTFVCVNPMNDIMAAQGCRMSYRIEVALYADEAGADESYGERFLGIADVTTPDFIISAHHAESAPYSLAYASPVAGSKLRVSWQAPDDATTFSLERSCDGAEFVRVYEGGKKSFVDTVPKDAQTVAYRVSARSSSWWYGESELTLSTNLYIGTGDGIFPIGGLFIGRGGEIAEVPPIMSVGGIE